jgi:hypothetical protein
MSKLFILISILITVGIFPCNSQNLLSGVFKFSTYEIIYPDSTNKETEGRKSFLHLWYKDSCAIIEHRINYGTEEETATGVIRKESYPAYRFSFINLRTLQCQDYLHLSDTAKPFCNYLRKTTDRIENNFFFTTKSKYDTLGGTHIMSDTIIDGITYKRIKILYQNYEYEKSYSILYLDCRPNNSMFYFNKTLTDLYNGCKAFRTDFCDSTGRSVIRSEMLTVSNKLSTSENKLFDCWKKNAAITTLPLISYSEAKEIMIFDIKHENPRITFKPYDKKINLISIK